MEAVLLPRLAITFFHYPENVGKIPFTQGKRVITSYLWVISKITVEFLVVKGKVQGKARVKFLLVYYSSARATHSLISNVRHKYN